MRFVSDLTIKTQDKYMKFDQIQKYSHFKVKRLSICQKQFVLNYGEKQWPGGVLQLALRTPYLQNTYLRLLLYCRKSLWHIKSDQNSCLNITNNSWKNIWLELIAPANWLEFYRCFLKTNYTPNYLLKLKIKLEASFCLYDAFDTIRYND